MLLASSTPFCASLDSGLGVGFSREKMNRSSSYPEYILDILFVMVNEFVHQKPSSPPRCSKDEMTDLFSLLNIGSGLT